MDQEEKDAPVKRKTSFVDEIKDSETARCVWTGITSVCGSLLLLLILLVFFGLAIQFFEAEAEINENIEFDALLFRLENNSVALEDIELIAQLAGRDIERGLEGFSTFIGDVDWSGERFNAISSSISYAFDLASTIGYGNVPAKTRGGRSVSIIAIFLLIPLTIVSYTRLAEFVENKIGNIIISREKEFRNVIKKYDEDNDGKIDAKELYLIFQDLGLQVTNEQCLRILQQYDYSNDKELNEDEFRQLCVTLRIRVGLLARPNLRLEVSLVLFLLYVIFFTVITRVAFVDNYFDSFYFVVITMTTVGLGDVVPPQDLRGIFSILAFIGIGFMTLVFKAIVDIIYERTDLRKRYFHRSLEPVFEGDDGRGPVTGVRVPEKLVPGEEDEADVLEGETKAQ